MHPSSSSNAQQPWHFDENIYPDIIAAENTQDDRPYRLVEGGALDYKRVQKLYDESPPPGYTIAFVQVIYDQRMQERFEVELNFLEQRACANVAAPFKVNWVEECASPEEKKARQHVFNHLVKRSQTPSGFRHVKVLPMFHGTKQAVLDSIFRVGFTVLAKRKGDHNDPGYFGKGNYLTSSAQYAYGMYGSDHILLYNWASYFAAYPIVHNNGDWLEKHAGKQHYNNYDAHYVLVNPLDPNNPNENSYFPIQGTEKHAYDELVIFQSNQILPRYIVHLESTGLNLKQVPTKTDSIFGNVFGFFSNEVELTVLIHEINTYLQSKKRLEIEKSLDIPTKNGLEIELKHKLETLSKRDSKAHLENEEAWLLRQLLCILKNRNEKITKLLLNALCARIIPQDKKIAFIGLLQSYYKSKNSIPRFFNVPMHIEQNYVQLVLVEGQPLTHVKKHSSIELNSLFDPKKEEEKAPRHLAIIGRAGIGKSTLCQYICYEWANNKLWNDKFEAVIWIPLRQLLNLKEDISLYDLVRRFCILPSGRREINADQIKEYLLQSEGKVLFVLDGYDEISGSLEPESFIQDLVQELLQQKNYLITSRHHAVEELIVDRTFENIGFSPSHVREYITKNLLPKDNEALLKQLKSQPWLSEIANVPLNLELICSTWQGQNKDLFSNISSLYSKFTLDLLKRFLARRGIASASRWEFADFEVKFFAELQFLEHLAWEGLIQKKLILPLMEKAYHEVYLKYRPDDPDDRPNFDKTILDLGFVRTLGTSSILSEQEVEFIHLTFQEFYAAKYICRLIKNNISKASKLIRLHKFNPHFQLVWSFAAGILKDQSENLRLYFQLLNETVDLAGFYGFQLKMRCLEELKWSQDLIEQDKDLQTALDWMQWVKLFPTFIDDRLSKCFRDSPLLRQKVAVHVNLPTSWQKITMENDQFDPSIAHGVSSYSSLFLKKRENSSPQFVPELLPAEKVDMFFLAVKNAFGRDAKHSKEELVTLRNTSKELAKLITTYPEKTLKAVSSLFQYLKDQNLDNTPSIIAYIERVSKKHSYFFRNIFFLYELLASIDKKYTEHEKQHILNSLFSILLTHKHLNTTEDLMECFTNILFSGSQSSLDFIKHSISVFAENDLLIHFLKSCANLNLLRNHFNFATLDEKNHHLFTQAVSFSLSNLTAHDLASVVPLLTRIGKSNPELMKEFAEFFIYSFNEMPLENDSYKFYLSTWDLSLASPAFIPTVRTLKAWISQSKSPRLWALTKTPLPHVIGWLTHWKNNTKDDLSLLRDLCVEAPQAFTSNWLDDLLSRIEKDEVNRETYLRVVVLICIREGIGLFLMGNEVCFYKNGLQKYKVSDPKWFSVTCQALSKTLLDDLKPIEKAI